MRIDDRYNMPPGAADSASGIRCERQRRTIISRAAMSRIDATIDFDPKSPPFDRFKGIQPIATDRRGHVSVESARHHLYVGSDRQSHASVLIKVTSRPGLTYQDNLANEIASLLTINGSLPESRYFPVVREHGRLRDGRVYIVESFFHEFPLASAIGKERIHGKTVAYIRTAIEIARALGNCTA